MLVYTLFFTSAKFPDPSPVKREGLDVSFIITKGGKLDCALLCV
jgi:hypothetical protein